MGKETWKVNITSHKKVFRMKTSACREAWKVVLLFPLGQENQILLFCISHSHAGGRSLFIICYLQTVYTQSTALRPLKLACHCLEGDNDRWDSRFKGSGRWCETINLVCLNDKYWLRRPGYKAKSRGTYLLEQCIRYHSGYNSIIHHHFGK